MSVFRERAVSLGESLLYLNGALYRGKDDVAGYSRLMEIDEEGTLKMLTECRTITDDLIGHHAGRIFGTAGDGVLAEFASGRQDGDQFALERR